MTALRPYRGTVYFTVAVRDLDDVDRLLDDLADVLSKHDGTLEVASAGHMDDADVIPGSPLDLILNEDAR